MIGIKTSLWTNDGERILIVGNSKMQDITDVVRILRNFLHPYFSALFLISKFREIKEWTSCVSDTTEEAQAFLDAQPFKAQQKIYYNIFKV